MKKIIMMISLCVAVWAAAANPVSPITASRVANHFWQSVLHGQGKLHACEWRFSEVYLFVGEERGFVMVSADDCARPVIAYSLNGIINPEALPEQLSKRMEAYNDYIAAGKQQHVEAVASDASAWGRLIDNAVRKDGDDDDRVDPLLETLWNQDGAYALYTPRHTPTGCAATAQAQYMRFWKFPAFGWGRETYNCQPYGAQSADFAHTLYDWDNMPSEVFLTSPREEQEAVSTLMYHVGVSLNMGYAPGGSAAAGLAGRPGIASIDNSLMDYFYYSKNMKALFKNEGYTDQRWADSLKAELQAGRPIIYCGVAPEGGHGFLCDGYEYRDGQIYFHFNFGWSGRGDGYFTADDICPNVSPTGQEGEAYHFTQSNQALVRAIPDFKMHVSDTLVNFTREGGEVSVLFSSIDTVDTPWTVTADQPWVSVNTNGVEHAGAITITTQANDMATEREATVTFSQNGESLTVKVVQTYYSVEDYCPLTVIMESTRSGGWEGGAYLSFESLTGYVYGTAKLETGRSETVEVGVPPHDVNVVFHHGGGTDRYINYRVKNQYDEDLVNVSYAFMNGGTHFIEWPCVHVGIDEAENGGALGRVEVWPNPASNRLNIACDQLLRAEVIDACGQVVAATMERQVNIESLMRGVYFVRVVTPEGVAVKKIIKN